MATAPVLVQSQIVHSTVNGPATITATLPGPSTTGNMLILVVAVSSSASGAITTPGTWILLGTSSNGGARVVAFFALPNNVGGISSVLVTVTATAGGAVAAMLEYSGLGNALVTEFTLALIGSIQIPPVNSFPPAISAGELWMYAICFNALNAYTASNSGFDPGILADSSTGATTNIRMVMCWGVTIGPGNLVDAGVLSNAVGWAKEVARITS